MVQDPVRSREDLGRGVVWAADDPENAESAVSPAAVRRHSITAAACPNGFATSVYAMWETAWPVPDSDCSLRPAFLDRGEGGSALVSTSGFPRPPSMIGAGVAVAAAIILGPYRTPRIASRGRVRRPCQLIAGGAQPRSPEGLVVRAALSVPNAPVHVPGPPIRPSTWKLRLPRWPQ
jgi:hypothetical protein